MEMELAGSEKIDKPVEEIPKLRQLLEGSGEGLEDAGLLDSENPEMIEQVFTSIATHAEHVRNGEEDSIRPAIFWGGGGSRGADAIGLGMALQLRKLSQGCRTSFGNSTGAHVATAFLTGELERGSNSYRNVVTGKDFLNVKRGMRGIFIDPLVRRLGFETAFRPLVDVAKPLRVYTGHEATTSGRGAFTLEWNTKNHELIFQVTDVETGEPQLLFPNSENVLEAIEASTALPPPLYKYVDWDGCKVADGGLVDPMPIERVVQSLAAKNEKPTHIIIAATRMRTEMGPNAPQPGIGDRLKKTGKEAVLGSWPKHLKDGYLHEGEAFARSIEYLKGSGIPYVIVWTDGSLGTFTVDKEKIEAATLKSFQRSYCTLNKYLPYSRKKSTGGLN